MSKTSITGAIAESCKVSDEEYKYVIVIYIYIQILSATQWELRSVFNSAVVPQATDLPIHNYRSRSGGVTNCEIRRCSRSSQHKSASVASLTAGA